MTATEVPFIGPAVDWQRSGRAEWERLSPRAQSRAKFALLIAATLAAYHYSLGTLAHTLTSDSPLAYLGLVPVLALGLAWLHRRPTGYEPPIHDRQLDSSLGIPLIVAPLLAAYILPARLGAMAWVNRVDLLFLPLFVTGATILLFGVRVAWRQKAALLFLFLAWPWPYTTILLGTLGGFRELTLHGLRFALGVIPVATPVGSAADTTLFQVVHNGNAFPVSIVTACSGVDGMVGFLLIGTALATVVRGPFVRKLLWLAAGMVVLWCMNLARLLLVFWAGQTFGRDFAIGGLHTYIGFVFFAISMVTVLALLRPFGLRLPTGSPRPAPEHAPGKSAVPHVFLVGAVLLTVAVLVSGGNAGLRLFDPVATAAGEPRLSSYLARPATPVGWTPTFQIEYLTAKSLFGESSRWFRYLYSPTAPARAALKSNLPVTADVIDERGLGGFSSYGITACYAFHGYKLRDVASVDLGDGINGQTLSYASKHAQQDWSIVWWVWPVRTGDGTRYERVVLSLQNTEAGEVHAPASAKISPNTDELQHRLDVNRAFLVGFGREIVAAQRHHRDFDARVTTVAAPSAARAAWLARKGGPNPTPVKGGAGVTVNGGAGIAATAPSASSVHDAFWFEYFRRHPKAAAGSDG